MTGNVQVRLGFGKAVLSTSTITLSSFKVDAPWTRSPSQTSGRRSFGTSSQQEVGHPGVNGRVYTDVVGHDPNTILLLQVQVARRGAPVSDGAIILRLRPGAAVLNIGAKLPPASDNFLGTRFCMFEGQADILSVEEAELLGVRVPLGFIAKFFDPEQIEERFDVLELTPAVMAQPELQVISTSAGTQVVEVAAAPIRRMRIRR